MTIKQFSRFFVLWLMLISSGLLAQEPRLGEDIVAQNCMGCHVSGAARAPRPDHLGDWERVFARNNYATVIQRAYDGFGRMPARGFCADCNRADIESAIRTMMPQTLLEHFPEEAPDS